MDNKNYWLDGDIEKAKRELPPIEMGDFEFDMYDDEEAQKNYEEYKRLTGNE